MEGKTTSTLDPHNSSNLLATIERMHDAVPAGDHVRKEEGKCAKLIIYLLLVLPQQRDKDGEGASLR